ESLAQLHSIGNKKYRGMNLAFLAVSESMLGRQAEGRSNFAAAGDLFREVGDQGSFEMLQTLEGLLELSEARSEAQAGNQEEADRLRASARGRLDSNTSSTESLILARR